MSLLRRVAANLGWLLGGRTSAALVTLAATALMARALEPAMFGMVVLVHSAALTVRQVCNIGNAEGVVRFGTTLADSNAKAFLALVGGLWRMDVVAASVAALVGVVLLVYVAEPVGLTGAPLATAWLYVPALFLAATSTAKGTLRVLDEYRTLSAVLVVGPLLRLVGVVGCGYVDAEPAAYIAVWAVAYAVEQVVLVAAAARSVNGLLYELPWGSMRAALRGHHGLGAFLRVVYWQSTLDVFPKHVVTLLVGSIVGAAGAGIFRLARDFASVLGKPVALLRQAVFPDQTRLWQNDRARFLRLTYGVCAAMIALGGVVTWAAVVYGEALLVWVAGPAFGAGGVVLALLMLAAALDLGGSALRPASYVMDRAVAVLRLQILVTSVYVVGVVALGLWLGLSGVGWAAVVSAAISLVGLFLIVHRAFGEMS